MIYLEMAAYIVMIVSLTFVVVFSLRAEKYQRKAMEHLNDGVSLSLRAWADLDRRVKVIESQRGQMTED